MPNYCHNDLYISGPQEQVDALLALVGADKESPEFDFNKIVAYPSRFAERDKEMKDLGYKAFSEKYGKDAKDGYNSGGYEWCTENWGTKWNAIDVARRDYGGVCITFQTAWAPPRPVIVALGKRFPSCSLYFESFECGMEFAAGFSIFSKDDWSDDKEFVPGEVCHEWKGDYFGHRGG